MTEWGFNCVVCGTELSRRKKYCSVACRDAATKRVVPKRCKTCGTHFVGPANRKYCSRHCKDKYRRFVDALRTGIRLRDVHVPGRLHCYKCGTFKAPDEFSRRSGSPTTLCKSCKQQGDRRLRRQQAEARGVVIQSLAGALERSMTSLAQKNAYQAWTHWLNERAPDSWLDRYWQATSEPWRDPRLSDAEKYRVRYSLDEEFVIKERLRSMERKRRRNGRINELMRRALNDQGKSARLLDLVGYEVSELRDHLERQFTRGMNWEKFRNGDIHIDHIIPQSQFDMHDHDEVRACFALSNLRPLWAKDNIRKGTKIVTLC